MRNFTLFTAARDIFCALDAFKMRLGSASAGSLEPGLKSLQHSPHLWLEGMGLTVFSPKKPTHKTWILTISVSTPYVQEIFPGGRQIWVPLSNTLLFYFTFYTDF